MKVLFVAHSGDLSGGANRSLLSIMRGLRDTYGIVPSVLLPTAGGEMQRECDREGIPVYVAGYHTCCTVYRREAKDILRFCKILATPVLDWYFAFQLHKQLPADIDLIYTNERMVVAGAYLAKLRKKSHIWHVRSFSVENATFYPPRYYKLMERYSDRIVLISKALFQTFANHIEERKLAMVHNGVEIEKYSVTEKIPHDGYRMLLTGRIVPPKGQYEAVQALAKLPAEISKKMELYFAGDIPLYDGGSYKAQLTKFIEESGLQKRVHFLGEVRDISALRKEMDLELVCSWCETFGRVTVEAMCAKLPVIGSNAGGTPEILMDGVTGLLYQPHNTEQLAENILWCAEHPEKTSLMAEAGYQRAKENFSIEATVQKIHQVISQVKMEASH